MLGILLASRILCGTFCQVGQTVSLSLSWIPHHPISRSRVYFFWWHLPRVGVPAIHGPWVFSLPFSYPSRLPYVLIHLLFISFSTPSHILSFSAGWALSLAWPRFYSVHGLLRVRRSSHRNRIRPCTLLTSYCSSGFLFRVFSSSACVSPWTCHYIWRDLSHKFVSCSLFIFGAASKNDA